MAANRVSVGTDPAPMDVRDGYYVKFLTARGANPIAGDNSDRWPLPTANEDGSVTPGEWTEEVTNPRMCNKGWHVATNLGISAYISDRAFLAEIAGTVVENEDKLCASQGRLVKELTLFQDPATRRSYVLALLERLSEAWARAEAEPAVLGNFIAAYGAYSANIEDAALRDAMTEAGAALRQYVRNDFHPNSKKPVEGVPSIVVDIVANVVASKGDIDPHTLGVNMACARRALIEVAHQDAVNAKQKWTDALEDEAEAAAAEVVGNMFVEMMGGGAIVLSPQAQLRQAIRGLAASRTSATSAAAAIEAAQATIAKATASIEAATAALQVAQEREATLAAQVLELAGGDPLAAITAAIGMASPGRK